MEKKLLILFLLLTGCTQIAEQQQAPVKFIENEKKDEYIDYIEKEVSESAAALVAVVDNVAKPNSDVIQLTITRLSGIKPPEKGQIDKYVLALKDKGVLVNEQKIAERVKQESDDLYAVVVEVDEENKSLKEQIRLLKESAKEQSMLRIREEAYNDIKKVCTALGGILTLAGIGIAVTGSWIGTGIKQGVVIAVCGMCIISAPLVIQDIVESIWFKVGIGTCFAIAFGYGLWIMFHTDKKMKSIVVSKSDSAVSS